MWSRVGSIDVYIQREEPFKKIKVDEGAAKEDVLHLLTELWGIAKQLMPFMPTTSEAILTAIRENKKPENLFPRLV